MRFFEMLVVILFCVSIFAFLLCMRKIQVKCQRLGVSAASNKTSENCGLDRGACLKVGGGGAAG
jgi:hypothetical protein